uniref:Uncharacterized protein n=1 Tax=Avena sativa TaxID=4498 RepID=A0ACD5WM06_AVESA
MGYKIKYKNEAGNRGCSSGDGGGGGGGGDDEATLPTPPQPSLSPPRLPRSPASTLPSPDPRALATSRLPLQRPRLPPRAADQDKEPLLALIREHSNAVIREKIQILSQRYVRFRRTCADSTCFYRAFLFSYLETLGQLQDRQAEVTRLMERIDTSKESFCGLNWDKAYLSNPEQYFSSAMADFNDLVNSVANGLSSDERFKSCSQTEIRTRGDDYRPYQANDVDALTYCRKMVRPLDAVASPLEMRAVTSALGIPLRVEAVDRSLREGLAKVRRYGFFPDRLDLMQWSSITSPTPLEVATGNLLSSDGTPLLTLMSLQNRKCDPKPWYILYRE